MTQDVAIQSPFMVFTDLDGSLLEHTSYSMAAAHPALQALADRHITPVFASSKTAAEILSLQDAIGFKAPFICENGAAIYDSPSGSKEPAKVFGTTCADWLPRVHAIRERMQLNFTGFADCSDEEVAALTGLSLTASKQARARKYSEPILWQDTEANFHRFVEALRTLQLSTLEGGRFISIQSEFDKSLPMKWWQSRCSEPKPFLVSLGDSPNDEALLSAADVAVVIKSAKPDQLSPIGPRKIIRTTLPGPTGWNDAITEILALLDTGQLFNS